jgi:hypothetical protein
LIRRQQAAGGEAVEDLVGRLVPDERLRCSSRPVIQVRIEATRSRTERWLPRLIHFGVSSIHPPEVMLRGGSGETLVS